MVSIAGSLSAIPYLVFLLFLYFVYVMIMRQKYSKDVEGKIYGEFFTRSGQSYGALCVEDKGYVSAPKGHEIGGYFVTPDCSYDFLYPPGKMRLMQARVRRSVWFENNPVPRVSVDPQLWIESKKMVEITSYMIESAANEKWQKGAMETMKPFFEDIANIGKFIKNMPYALYASIGALFAAGIAAYFAYMVYVFLRSRFP